MSSPLSRRQALHASLVTGLGLLAGCGAMLPRQHKEATDLAGIGAGSVLVVGRIELTPGLRPGEQQLYDRQWDPLKAGDSVRDRAVLFLAGRADLPREPTGDMLAPPLDRFFFVPVPLERRHVTHALIYLEARLRATGPRTASHESAELWLPAPVVLDLRPADRAVYVGTWRIWRDEFNQVLRTQVLDQHAAAEAELQPRFGALPLRKALAILPPRTPAAIT